MVRTIRYCLTLGWISLLPISTFIFSNLDDGSIGVSNLLLLFAFLVFSSAVSLVCLSTFGKKNRLRFAISYVLFIYWFFNYKLTSKIYDKSILFLERIELNPSFIAIHPVIGKLFLWAVISLLTLLAIRFVAGTGFFEPFLKVFSILCSLLIVGQVGFSIAHVNSVGSSVDSRRSTNEVAKEIKNNYPNVIVFLIDSLPNDVAQTDFFERNDLYLSTELEEMGFVVAKESRSNYQSTAVSVSSMLNMDYHPIGALGEKNVYFYDQLAHDSASSELFKDHGYSVGLAPSGVWSGWDCGGAENFCLEPAKTGLLSLDEFASSLLSLTPLSEVPLLDARYSDLDFLYFEAKKLRSEPFVLFIHGMDVHAPFKWNEKCLITKPRTDTASFIASIKCLETRVIEQLRSIPEEVVVLIQADHGTENQSYLNEKSLPSGVSQIEQRFFAYSALRLPATCRESVPLNLTPVNVLRLTTNCLFNLKQPLLPNRFFDKFGQEHK